MKLRIAAIQENLVWYSDSCIEQLFGFCRFSFFMFHLLLTTHNPMDECYQGYDNHMIRTATNRIGQWVCSVICVGVCDCDESLLKLECLVLGNFLMRLSHIWEKKIPEEKIKCCTMLMLVLLYFLSSKSTWKKNQRASWLEKWGAKTLNLDSH